MPAGSFYIACEWISRFSISANTPDFSANVCCYNNHSSLSLRLIGYQIPACAAAGGAVWLSFCHGNRRPSLLMQAPPERARLPFQMQNHTGGARPYPINIFNRDGCPISRLFFKKRLFASPVCYFPAACLRESASFSSICRAIWPRSAPSSANTTQPSSSIYTSTVRSAIPRW